eukprot:TRINITY_DN61313_c0_g1_i1.p1 TRINITY_DN61313_c0_g1~~TRINITY_DN61313_c0_g1_i1.p1  ORF type:complete len:442 (-),score=92.38 TRINITY_DN61313_c0_g1_i1:101-1267(-)
MAVFLLLVLCTELSLAGAAAAPARDGRPVRLIGYFDAKSQKELSLQSLRHENLTHLVLTNAVKVDNQGNLVLRAEPGELSAEETIARLATLPVKLIISLRGHEDDVALDELAEVDDLRTRFASQIATKLKQWGASGLEIEWHSDDPNGGKATAEPFDIMEQYHFALLCRDLAVAFRGAGNKTISVAVRPGRQEFNQSAFVNKYIDWLALRAYSMRSLGDPHHSSLKDMKTALDEWESKGVHKEKLVLGTALFGRPGASLHTAGDRNEALRVSWKDLAEGGRYVAPRSDRNGDVFKDVRSGKAWWISGLSTTRAKVKYVADNGYGGIALRDLHQDSPGELSLVQAAAAALVEVSVRTSRLRRVLAKPVSLLQKGLLRSQTRGLAPEKEL